MPKKVEFEHAVAEARLHGTIYGGGHQLTEGALGHGHFVEPTIVELPADHPIWSTELFLPFVALQRIDSFAQALALANASEYGLTAGLYSTDDDEIDQFLNEIQAGVIYVNRRAGATTGAWPGSQPFGGWKGSGTTGRGSGGPWYLQQYLREQSQTVLHQAP